MSNDVPPPNKQIPHIRETPLIGSFQDFRHNRLEFFMRISREFPEVGAFHVGPMRIVLITSAQVAQSVLVSQSDDFYSGKLLQAIVPLVGRRSLMIIYGEEHRQQRKLMAYAFQPRRLHEFAPTIVDYTAQMVESWAEGEVIDITEEMPILTMRIVGKTLFDVDFSSEAKEFHEAMRVSVDYLDELASALVPVPLWVPTPGNVRARRALATIRERQTALIEERRRGNQGRDLLSTLINYRDENGQGLSDEQLRDHASTIFVAGHETVAIAMGWMWYLLQKHPDVLQRLQQEVDTVLEGRLPTTEDLPRLTYSLQVIKEAMRLYPPAFMIGRAALRDTNIEGYALRKNDIVLISPYTLHRKETVFPEPEEFRPERFTPEQEKSRSRFSYIPFSVGPHVCPGNNYSIMEAQLLLSVMLQRVHLEALPGQNVVPVPGVSLRMSGYKLRVRRRASAAPRQTAAAVS